MPDLLTDLARKERTLDANTRTYVKSLAPDWKPLPVSTCISEVDESLGPDLYDPEDVRLRGELRQEGWPG